MAINLDTGDWTPGGGGGTGFDTGLSERSVFAVRAPSLFLEQGTAILIAMGLLALGNQVRHGT